MALNTLEFNLGLGLRTKYRHESTEGFTTLQNMDHYDLGGAIGKTPGTSVASQLAGSAWRSLHYFEYFDLTGVFQRKRIGLTDNGFLREIASDQSLSSIYTGLVAENLSTLTVNNRLHIFSANNSPLKWDGTDVTNCGLKAPGLEETVVEPFTDAATFTINASHTKSNSTASRDGTGSVQVNKAAGSATLTLSKPGYTQDWSSIDQAWFYFLVPSGGLAKLANSGAALTISAGDTGLSNTNNFTFSVGDLVDGWNLLSFDVDDPDSTTGTGATLSTIQAIKFSISFVSADSTQSGFLFDQLYTTPVGTLTATVGGSGNVNSGTIQYKTTFLSRYGLESNASSASTSVTSVGSQISLTNIPTASDSQVVARRIYRNFNGSNEYSFLVQIDDNITTTYADNTANSGLSITLQPPIASSAIDNSPPTKMIKVVKWNGWNFGIDSVDRGVLNVSERYQPEIWPINYTQSFDSELITLLPTTRSLLIFFSDKIVEVTGGTDGRNSLSFDEFLNDFGCMGLLTVIGIRNYYIFWHEDGPYVGGHGYDPVYIGKDIRDIIDTFPKSQLSNIFIVHDKSRYRIIFFIPDSNGDYTNVYSYSYGGIGAGSIARDGIGADPLELTTGSWTKISFPSGYNIQCSAITETEVDTPEIWLGDEGGYIYKFDNSNLNWANGALDASISASFETTYRKIGLDYETGGKPAYLIVNAKATNQATWTYTVTLAKDADGPEITSATGTVTIGAGNSSKRVPLSLPAGNFIKVKLENNSEDQTGIIKSLRIDWIPQPGTGQR